MIIPPIHQILYILEVIPRDQFGIGIKSGIGTAHLLIPNIYQILYILQVVPQDQFGIGNPIWNSRRNLESGILEAVLQDQRIGIVRLIIPLIRVYLNLSKVLSPHFLIDFILLLPSEEV